MNCEFYRILELHLFEYPFSLGENNINFVFYLFFEKAALSFIDDFYGLLVFN